MTITSYQQQIPSEIATTTTTATGSTTTDEESSFLMSSTTTTATTIGRGIQSTKSNSFNKSIFQQLLGGGGVLLLLLVVGLLVDSSSSFAPPQQEEGAINGDKNTKSEESSLLTSITQLTAGGTATTTTSTTTTTTRFCTFEECIAARCDHTIAPYICLFHNGGPHGGCSTIPWDETTCSESCDLSKCHTMDIPNYITTCAGVKCTTEWCTIGQLCGPSAPYQCQEGAGRFGCSDDPFHWVLYGCSCCDATTC